MAKKSKKLVLSILFLPLLYAALLRCNLSPPLHTWKLQLMSARWGSSSTLRSNDTGGGGGGVEVTEFTRFLLRRLVRGKARQELNKHGITCTSNTESDICITTDSISLATTSTSSPSSAPLLLYLTSNQHLPLQTPNKSIQIRPYPRKTDPLAMARTSAVTILSSDEHFPPPCDVTHSVPAIILSNGGFAGNFFHDISEIIIPLFLTSVHLRSRVQLVVTDYEPYWVKKYRRILSHLSAFDIIVASSSSVPVVPKVHCFPAAVVGLKYHGNLLCNSTSAPGGISNLDFRHFLLTSLSLNSSPVSATTDPILLLLSRRKSRMLLNEGKVIRLAKHLGFRVVVATPQRMSKMEEFAELVNGCSVLMGVHGAGLTNMVFLRPEAVVVQVVPWGLDWASAVYYGRPAQRMGLKYLEYHIQVEESTLSDEYPKDHPVLVDPWGINLKGYNVSKPVYTDGQNLRIDLVRFKETLSKARQMLPRPAFR